MAIIDKYLSKMLEDGGKILHIGSGRKMLYRLNDQLTGFDEAELSADKVSVMLKEIAGIERWKRFMEEKDIDFTYDLNTVARFRCNFFFDRAGAGAVLRYTPTTVPSLDAIDAPQALKDICHLPGGLVLVCGVSGTGNTQAAMTEYINENTAKYIVAITDMAAYTHSSDRSVVEQCEVGIGNFADTMENVLYAHPDVIVISALPDSRTMRMALRAAMMGILVIAALPCGNVAKTLDYIFESFPASERSEVRTMLAESLQAILAQVNCRGVNGAAVICREILLRAEGVPAAIREGSIASLRAIMDANRAGGMRTMDFSLREQLAAGKISADEAYAKAADKKQFQQFLTARSK